MKDGRLFELFAIFAPDPPAWWVEENEYKYFRQIESGKNDLDRLSLLCDWRWAYASAMISRKQRKGDLVREVPSRDTTDLERVGRVAGL